MHQGIIGTTGSLFGTNIYVTVNVPVPQMVADEFTIVEGQYSYLLTRPFIQSKPICAFLNGIGVQFNMVDQNIVLTQDNKLKDGWELKVCYWIEGCIVGQEPGSGALTNNQRISTIGNPSAIQEEIILASTPPIINNLQRKQILLSKEPLQWEDVKLYVNGVKVDMGTYDVNTDTINNGDAGFDNILLNQADLMFNTNLYKLETTDVLGFEYEYIAPVNEIPQAILSLFP